MSSPPSENEHAAPAALVNSEHGQDTIREGDHKKSRRWTRSSRSNSTSLLTQALAAEKESEEKAAAQKPFPEASTTSTQPASLLSNDQSNNDLKPSDSTGSAEGKMAMVMPGHTGNAGVSIGPKANPTSSSARFDPKDTSMEHVNALLARDLMNSMKGRGTSLERTEKEKRVQHSLKGSRHSTNPGDTALPPSAAPSSSALDSISTNPPTEGVRAEYRSWREPRPGMAAEKAWSIGQDGNFDDSDGQVEKSIKDAMAGVEPNNRSRKASHSLRFFKEGLPEDTTRKRDAKSRGRSKEGSQRAKPATISVPRSPLERPRAGNTSMSGGRSPISPRSNMQPATTSPTAESSAVRGYFDSTHRTEGVSAKQANAMPAGLLAEIRKHHNLTPGAEKGSSFSRSIPAAESERNKSYEDRKESLAAEQDRQADDDGDELSPVKSADEEDESGEDYISSALFVPHHTPHESPERKRGSFETTTRPGLGEKRQSEVSNSQQWLEEYKVPSRELDQKYLSQEAKARPLPSPTRMTAPSPQDEKQIISPGSQDTHGFEQAPLDEEGYTTAGEESSTAGDDDITPTGSPKQGKEISPLYNQHIHDHQHQTIQPLEAIELIPYRHQVGGHTTMWRFSKKAVCKQLNNRENEFYEKVERYHPQLLQFLPRYIGVLNVIYEKQPKRKLTKKDGADLATNKQEATQAGTLGQIKDQLAESASNSGGASENSELQHGRVISQSLQSSSVPVPTVTFADNRHIIPKSFMQPHPYLVDSQHRSKSDSAALSKVASQSATNLPTSDVQFRPTLSDKHAVSWGATTVNKQLRNQVFNEAFLNDPIPVHRHKRPASQHRSLPTRHGGSGLRTSTSESSLKAAQQSQSSIPAPPAEESIRRKAIKTAAGQRNGLTPLTSTSQAAQNSYENGALVEESEAELDKKTGTSAPEPEIVRSPKSHRQRRYSSGGLRRKPTAVAEDRGNLKYFEEADDVGFKGDTDDNADADVFPMDLETTGKPVSASDAKDKGKVHQDAFADSEFSKLSGSTTPTPEAEPSDILHIPRPVNPKEAQTQSDSRVDYFLLLEDLTAGMKRPCIMDLKMGTRQYGVGANEKKQESQRRKCADTTSQELGVRVCGLQVWDIPTQQYIFLDKYFGRDLKVGRAFQDALKRFLYDGVDYSSILRHIPTIIEKLSELEVIIRGLDGYRFYAASLLMVYDGDTQREDESDSTATDKSLTRKKEIDFKIADFANCVTKEDLRPQDRICPPRHPELPDNGFLRGLRSLRKYFLAIQREVYAKEMGRPEHELENAPKIDSEDDGTVSY